MRRQCVSSLSNRVAGVSKSCLLGNRASTPSSSDGVPPTQTTWGLVSREQSLEAADHAEGLISTPSFATATVSRPGPGDPTYHPLVHVSPALALQTGLQPLVNIVGCSLRRLQPLLYLGGTGEGHVGTVYCEGPSLTALSSSEQESLCSSLLSLPWPAGNDTTRPLPAGPACQPLY